ncbi:hypothetical protein DL769_003783 [Monosporascus sp. CRB-8-3]|nr:hypothetical protein DL769_003783 [Monosporascus sp. CRB-8-3]
MAKPERRRRRPATSCALCRRLCTYEFDPPQQSQPRPVGQGDNGVGQSHSPSTNATNGRPSKAQTHPQDPKTTSLTNGTPISGQPSTWEVELMKGRIRQLERQLSQATPTPTPSTTLEPYTSSIGGTWYKHGEDSPRPSIRETKPDTAFMILVKLVLAIGAAAYDAVFSLRKSAVHWIYEAQIWLAEPYTKHRLDLLGLQIHVLSLLAREIVGVDGDSIYISAGDLFRKAVIMGMHIDPIHAPQNSALVTEMRRRMWNTILEICLQSSLTSGGPPYFSLNDFETEPPRNLDDDQLGIDEPVAKPANEFTQVSFSLALRNTFPTRVAIVQLLNGLHVPSTYEETLRLDAELRDAYRTISYVFQPFKSNTSPGSGAFQFGLQTIDFLMQAYLSALHVPCFSPALNQSTFAFSRRVVVETALKIWYILRPPVNDINSYTRDHPAPASTSSDIGRFGACGNGIFRVAATQAALLVALELKTQLQEDERLASIPIRPDLLAVLRDALEWSLHRIRIGEPNIKGYLMFRMIRAQIEGLIQKLGKDEISRSLVRAVLEAESLTMPILERMAEQCPARDPAEALHASYTTPSETNWDMTWADGLSDAADMESMGWIFNDGSMQVSLW